MKTFKIVSRWLALLALATACAGAALAREQVTVAAAADLVYCMEALNAEFRGRHPEIELVLSTGSSGMFFTQIRNGAPFDIYLSADRRFPERLVAEGEAVADSLTTYAQGRIALWTMRNDLDLQAGLNVLRDPAVMRIAIANPEHAPYGQAARTAMQSARLWDEVRPKVVYGQNILHARQFVETGNADVGIVALSLLMAPAAQGKGRYELIPQELHPPLEQALVLTRHGRGNRSAEIYLRFLRSAPAKAIFERYGFTVPAT
jgi:molybdate transport system substrate-binding protein